MLGLVTGDAASGKSEFAESLAMKLSEKRIYAATMRNDGRESADRIQKHRLMRKDKGFITFECPMDAGAAAEQKLKENSSYFNGSCVLLEDVPNLAANEMFRDAGVVPDPGDDRMIRDLFGQIMYLSKNCLHIIMVTGNLFSGGYDHDDATMCYLKNLAMLNRELAKACDEVYEVVCGIPVLLKGKKI
ncbi:MAG: bifunctional adenosylcobinamide kinase/adenosylcobinamide-phosphate guanylyltransferase [Lachnospiraceae bacterium]|nr:bifunctional adenosylcobinamide kinase/adenosylcobinamide-phosphate guanylyltransferase [Lachnospiraceae bacterium]